MAKDIDEMRDELAELGNGAHALAQQLLGNADDAADAVHDAFAKALAAPGAYRAARGPLKPWFLTVVRNRCLDLLRKRRPVDNTVDELVDADATPEQAVEIAQRDAAIATALATLTTQQREIIVLRDYLDLSYAEMADVLGVAKGTIMSRLHRSRLALKEALTTHE